MKPWTQWNNKDMIKALETAMQLTMKVPCDCKSDEGVCEGDCAGSRIWNLIHQVRKRLKRMEKT